MFVQQAKLEPSILLWVDVDQYRPCSHLHEVRQAPSFVTVTSGWYWVLAKCLQ